MSNHIHETSVTELQEEIRRGSLSPVELVDTYLERIAERNDELNAYITVIEDDARERAREAEKKAKSGAFDGPLHGIPVAIKDLLGHKRGVRHTYGAKPFADNVSDHTATFVKRLEENGGIVLGKTNTPEFGYKGTTDNAIVGATGTPFDVAKTAGGSSGGSAAAVAAELAPFAQGSDVGGSVRIPAACCGVYGFLPTYGRVPYAHRPDGFISHTPFLGIGPLTRSVEDASLMLDVIDGFHPRDPLGAPDTGTNYRAATSRSIDDFDIAYSPDLEVFPVESDVERTVRSAAESLEDADATVTEVDLGLDLSRDDLVDFHVTVMGPYYAELAHNYRQEYGIDLLDRSDEIPDPVVDMIEAGNEISATDYRLADVVRTTFFDAIQDCFEEYDLLVTPTLGTTPFDKTLFGPGQVDGEEIDPFLGWFLTFPINMIGSPAASIPAGFVDGLPVGMQVVGQRFADEDVIAASSAFERLRPWQDEYHF